MSTGYFESTDGTLFITFLKKYRRYRCLVPLFSTFWTENFANFGSNIFGDLMRWTMIESLICVEVTGITCSVNESTGPITSKKITSSLHSLYYAQTCKELAGPFAATYIALGQHSSFWKKVAKVASRWQLCVRFDWPRIWTLHLPHQSLTCYRLGYLARGRIAS